MEPGSNLLILRCIGQHISCELFDSELVVGHILIESSDYPVAIGPNITGTIFLITITVGVACEVEPFSSPFLAVML